MRNALRKHWPEYLIEAAGLGVFMISAAVFGTLLGAPGSPVHQALPDPFFRRILMGLAMGLTAVGIIYSPWGRQSGAHINPAVTLTFLRLGKIRPWDAVFYVTAQFTGGVLGIVLATQLLGLALTDPPVSSVATVPGRLGEPLAFVGEASIAFLLMLTVLITGNSLRWSRFTGLAAGLLVASYITLEEPLSGMSMNPARTFASALPSGIWTGIWIYFSAPFVGMLVAAQLYLASSAQPAYCAKYNHHTHRRCIFRCRFDELLKQHQAQGTAVGEAEALALSNTGANR